jgi:4a-hydroxytetrahydrobiopterin dehydratase
MALADKSCIPCEGGVPPLEPHEIEPLLAELGGQWRLDSPGHLRKAYPFADFIAALGFADQIGLIAELEGHHPDLHVSWGHCDVEIWTHKIEGLSESDFILAAKIDRARAR